MNRLLSSTLNWHESTVSGFYEKHGGDEAAMLADLIKNHLGSMSTDARTKVFTYGYLHSPVMNEWATKHSIKILPELSDLEWKLVMSHNPFYLMFAFGVRYEIVLDFIKMNQLCVSDPIHAHAVVMMTLRQKPSVTLEAADEICRNCSIAVVPKNIAGVMPFSRDVLKGHPFENVDMNITSPGELGQMLRDKGMLLARIREKQHCTNYIEFNSNTSSYQLKTNNIACFQMLAKLINKPYDDA